MLTLPGILDIKAANLLAQDGELEYVFPFYPEDIALQIFSSLRHSLAWRSDPIQIYGQMVQQPRLVAWHGDPEAIYTYSKMTMLPAPWTKELLRIKADLEKYTGAIFNSVLINLYRDGRDHVSWHADNESELGSRPLIASLSLGQSRKFQVKHRTKRDLATLSLELESGSLVVMKGSMQEFWLHRLAPTKKIVGERINLTFRQIMG